MTKLTSCSALATLTVPSAVLQKDVLLHLIAKLASPLQLTLVVEKKKKVLSLELDSGVVLTERNAILRSLCGTALHHALDQRPYHLLGGHSISARASPVSAMALAGVSSWQSIADTLGGQDAQAFAGQLNDYLATRSFLIPSAQCTLADMDLCLNLIVSKKEVDYSVLHHVARWMHQVHAVLSEYAAEGIDIPSLPFEPAPETVPIFYNGTEENVVVAAPKGAAEAAKKQDNKAGGGLTEEQKKAAAEKRAAKKAAKPKKQPQPPPAATELDISALDIRVGKILKAWNHETADKLYCEEIDVGEEKPRQIASGLRPFYASNTDLENRMVLVLMNLKARTMLGFSSHGMVLCASNSDHTKVEIVTPPLSAKIGERVIFQGIDNKDAEPENRVGKKKIFEKLAPDLKTNAECGGYCRLERPCRNNFHWRTNCIVNHAQFASVLVRVKQAREAPLAFEFSVIDI